MQRGAGSADGGRDRWRRTRAAVRRFGPAAAPAVLAAWGLLGYTVSAGQVWLGLGLIAVQTLPLLWRRTHPRLVLAAVLVGLLLASLSPYADLQAADLSLLVALYAVTRHGRDAADLRAAVLGAVAGLVVIGGRIFLATPGGPLTPRYAVDGEIVLVMPDPLADRLEQTASAVVPLLLMAALAVGAGVLFRARQQSREAARERERLLQVERDQQTLLAVQAERARIARELHDVVAHSLAVMITQADGGRYAAAARPEAATEALARISAHGREAMTDMRRLLGVLRDPDGAHDGETAPQPGLADLGHLSRVLGPGAPRVVLTVDVDPEQVPEGRQLVAYRVVQEALTNALKHAQGATRVEVSVRQEDEVLVVQVVDDGSQAGPAGPTGGVGHGLRGMRERVSLYGGTLLASPSLGGGFLVRATIPVEPAPPVEPTPAVSP